MRYVARFPAFEDQGFSGLHRFAGAAANYIFANSPPPKNRYNLMTQSLTVSSACGQLAAALYGAVWSKLSNFHGQ